MRPLQWTLSHAVFVDEIDDDHKEIFETLSCLRTALSRGRKVEISKSIRRLADIVEGHFAHEERLMRAARYTSQRWHKQQHDHARKRVQQFVKRIQGGDPPAGGELLAFLATWLHDHTRLHDAMLGSFLRNHRRGLAKVTIRAGTRPAGECSWVDSRGEPFNPATTRGY